MPNWIVALISIIVGSVFTIFVQSFLKWRERRHALEDLRRILYQDIGELFLHVDGIINLGGIPDPVLARVREQELRDWIKFGREAYLNAKPDLYIQLAERPTADFLYLGYHRILDEMEHGYHVNAALANRHVAEAIEQGRLNPKYFRKYMGNDLLSQTLLSRAHELYSESEERRRATEKLGSPSEDR